MLVAYYCPEPMSAAIQKWLRRQRQPAVSDLVEVEVVSAIARKVRDRSMSRQDARQVAMMFASHLEDGYYTRLRVERIHYSLAVDWIGSFEIPLRTLDALHLAVSHSRGLRLATADESLARSARAVGVSVHRVA